MVRRDGGDFRSHLFEQIAISGNVPAQAVPVKIFNLVFPAAARQRLDQIIFLHGVGRVQDLLGLFPGGDDALVQHLQEPVMNQDHPFERFQKGIHARFQPLEEHHPHQAVQVGARPVQALVGLQVPFRGQDIMPQAEARVIQVRARTAVGFAA
ncbi:MAG: hypothetical protein BWY09_01385 [Candidatus Hydrogenedentes bacterium ADurb.Bin179]|nr:MAG: hypothetical protein BWY09_01385 [Candidatus Hydrogenedentes bacterium ADurb.Bin179]